MLHRIAKTAVAYRYVIWSTVAIMVAGLGLFGLPIKYQVPISRIHLDSGYAYITSVRLPWPLVIVSDDSEAVKASSTRLREDGRLLGPAHMSHVSIREVGGGRFSHWRGTLYFSASDNSDPRSNGRRYVASVRIRLAPGALLVGLLGCGAVCAWLASRWFASGLIVRPDILQPAGLWVGVALGLGAGSRAGGITSWLLMGLTVILLVWAVASTRRTVIKGTGQVWNGYGAAINATLLVTSLTMILAVVEAGLLAWEGRIAESSPADDAAERALDSFGIELPREVLLSAIRRGTLVTLPQELERQPLSVVGAAYAYKWHGVSHVYDANGMRRTTPFPSRRADVFRVMVVGDSMTYGVGIGERWNYPSQLERKLEPDYHLEVLNLGVSGLQSEDVLRMTREFLPILQPDLVVYGVCHNDFLPSGMQEDTEHFVPNSRLGRLGADAYRQVLLAMGMRQDFYDEVLDDLGGYQERFGRDVARLNELVRGSGLPPVVALVLDHRPNVDPRGHRLVQVAESRLEAAGMDVVDMAPYYRHFDSQDLRVSRWEGHPNEIAHAAWAEMLNRHLRNLPELRGFRGLGPEGSSR